MSTQSLLAIDPHKDHTQTRHIVDTHGFQQLHTVESSISVCKYMYCSICGVLHV